MARGKYAVSVWHPLINRGVAGVEEAREAETRQWHCGIITVLAP